MSPSDLVALVCCDLGAIVRGRAVMRSDLEEQLEAGVGWVPANLAITPLGTVAEPNPFGSTGDLRLLPDRETHVRVPPQDGRSALELLLCDIVETDGRPWECCPRQFLRGVLGKLEEELGWKVAASFEHEFQLELDSPPPAPFSLDAQRLAEPFGTRVMEALAEAGAQPERFFAEYAPHQFEIPVAPAAGLGSADRAVVVREVVREVARRCGTRASFAPLLDPEHAGNGVHVHVSVVDREGSWALYDPRRAGRLSELAERFAAGILLHGRALSAFTAPSPASAARLAPHRWSAGALCLGAGNRETLLRIPPLVSLAGADPAPQLRLEYRGADATASPYLTLGAILSAGLDGVRRELPAAPILDRDPATLHGEEAERFGVGGLPDSLGEALEALEDDATAKGWLPPLLHDAYTSVKRAEVEASADLDPAEICRRYARIY